MIRQILLLLSLLLGVPAQAAPPNCNPAKLSPDGRGASAPALKLYQQGLEALKQDDPGRADRLFRAAYAGAGMLADANEARLLARSSLARLIETSLVTDDKPTAYFRLLALRGLLADTLAEPWITEIMVAADTATIAIPESSATLTTMMACRNFGVEPKADVRILFETESSALTTAARAQVARLASSLLEAGVKTAVVRGHTDRHGTDAYNKALSERRAATVVAALQAAAPALIGRLKSEGYGKSQLRYPGEGEEIDKLNRRVEFLLN